MGRFAHAAGVAKVILSIVSDIIWPCRHDFRKWRARCRGGGPAAGVGQTDLQVQAAVDIGTTAYAGTLIISR